MPVKMIAITTPEQIESIWPAMESDDVIRLLPVQFPKTLTEFTLWVAQPTTRAFALLVAGHPIGLFVFTDITLRENANAHVFIWDHSDTYNPADIITNAQLACVAAMTGFKLLRITGLTPVDSLPARLFLTRVGFKVEGTIRDAMELTDGYVTDVWISGFTRNDCKEVLSRLSESGKLIEGESLAETTASLA
jgi:RimJ/RimL family protein N-acetyltransferase